MDPLQIEYKFRHTIRAIFESSSWDASIINLMNEFNTSYSNLVSHGTAPDIPITDKLTSRISKNSDETTFEPKLAIIPYKKYTCFKCGDTNPLNFNRKKTECTYCMSKELYAKMKPKIEEGKKRNAMARMARVECCDCKLKITETNIHMFDWDHRIPFEKSYQISRMNCKPDTIFYEEISKCDLVCRNCHTTRTKKQRESNIIAVRKPKKV